MTVLVDRAEGGISFHNGEIELMIQRIIKTEDQRGMGRAHFILFILLHH